MSASSIMPGHVIAFPAVTTQLYCQVTLWCCRINGELGVAIVLPQHVGENKLAVMSLFVAMTPRMEVTFEGEQDGSDDGGGGS